MGDIINTPYDEDAPFFTADGKTLFFASTGHNSIGGFDIFKSVLGDDGKWSTPENLGPTINTPAHDIYFVLDSKMDHAYFSSNRVQDSLIQMDIYTLYFECENIPLTTIRGFAKPGISFSIAEKYSNRMVGNYTTGDNGEYTLQLAPDNTYLFTLASTSTSRETPAEIVVPKQCKEFTIFQKLRMDSAFQQDTGAAEVNYTASARFDNLFFESSAPSENTINDMIAKAEKEKTEGYTTATAVTEGKYTVKPGVSSPVIASSPIAFQNILFEYDRSGLSNDASEELKKIIKYLKENKAQVITVSGHTDDAGTEEYNLNLSKKRTMAVVSYLTSKGIQKKRITYNSYGETKPLADNSTTEGKVKNRRVEIFISK